MIDYFRHITTFIFDVDGVLTNNSLLITEEGHLLRTMNARDGYAMQLALSKGYKVAIITGGKSEGVLQRLKNLGIFDIYYGIRDKGDALREFLLTYDDILPQHILYMGDDMIDLVILQQIGLPTCPADAVAEVKDICRYISPYEGGAGCVRDVIEKVLKLHNQWE